MLLAIYVLLHLATHSLSIAAHYPWIHYFLRPEMPVVHSASADSRGSIIVSTGDWFDGWFDWASGDYVYQYWSEGIFRICEGEIEGIECPANTFLLDTASDPTGTTWVLFASGSDYRTHLANAARRGGPESDTGFHWWRFPVLPSGTLSDYRLGYMSADSVVEVPDLSDGIPGRPERLISSPDGWFFLESGEWEDDVRTGNYLSWWRTDRLSHVQVLRVDRILPYGNVWGYPQFGSDVLAYFLFHYYHESDIRYGVLCIDPCSGQFGVIDYTSSPYLNSETEYFYIDALNIKWFATDDGLVRFDGETWARWTTENSGLPYNLVRQMLYDEVDGVYYVITQGNDVEGSYPYAFSTLSSTGESIGEPLDLPSSQYNLYHQSRIYRSAGNVFWLCPYRAGVVYSYDHKQVIEWQVADWLGPDTHVPYIGSTASGRTFCVDGYRVMIW